MISCSRSDIARAVSRDGLSSWRQAASGGQHYGGKTEAGGVVKPLVHAGCRGSGPYPAHLRHPPGGFEGLRAILVLLESRDPLILDRPDGSARVLDPCIASLQPATFADHGDHAVRCDIDELQRLRLVGIPGADPLLQRFDDA